MFIILTVKLLWWLQRWRESSLFYIAFYRPHPPPTSDPLSLNHCLLSRVFIYSYLKLNGKERSWNKDSGHHVRPQLGSRLTGANFSRTSMTNCFLQICIFFPSQNAGSQISLQISAGFKLPLFFTDLFRRTCPTVRTFTNTTTYSLFRGTCQIP